MDASHPDFHAFYERERRSYLEAISEAEGAHVEVVARAERAEAELAIVRKERDGLEEERRRAAESMKNATDVTAMLRRKNDEFDHECRQVKDTLVAALAEKDELKQALERERERSSQLFLKLEAGAVAKLSSERRSAGRVAELEERADRAQSAAERAEADAAKKAAEDAECLKTAQLALAQAQREGEAAVARGRREATAAIDGERMRLHSVRKERDASEKRCAVLEQKVLHLEQSARVLEEKMLAQRLYVASAIERFALSDKHPATVRPGKKRAARTALGLMATMNTQYEGTSSPSAMPAY